MTKREQFYTELDARRAQQDREVRAELAGYWAGCEGAERETPLTGALRDRWLQGYDSGSAAVAKKTGAA